jgi:UDP-3-O-[3-hydroxymyristoyl] glucosamine N-acyltransferase
MAAGDPRFFTRTGPHPLAVVAEAARGAVRDGAPSLTLAGIGPLQTATADEVSFLDNRKYISALRATKAGAVVVHPDLAAQVPAGTVAIASATPYESWAHVAALFHPPPPVCPGVHPSAVVEAGALIDPTTEVGPLAVIGAGASIGPRCRIGAHAVIGAGVVVGADCRIGPHASVTHAILGARVFVYPGARIGQEGFGFAQTARGFLTVPQVGRAVLEDDVEVGANSCVDRGSLHDTVIGAGSRLDNLVQVGHNVRIGRFCAIAGQAGISGSTILEDFVMVGGQAGFIGHLKIGKGAMLGAQTGVMEDVPAGGQWVGSPSQPARQFLRQVAMVKRLARRAPQQATGPEQPPLDRTAEKG